MIQLTYQHFHVTCHGSSDTVVEFKFKSKKTISKTNKPACLTNFKCFIIDHVNPKTIYKYLIGAISHKRVLHELFILEMKYQAKTLAFIHGLNTYVDWNATDGLRRGDNGREKEFKITIADYDNIFGMDTILTRDEFVELVNQKNESG